MAQPNPMMMSGPITVSAEGGGNFEQPAPGFYTAVCVDFVLLGQKQTNFGPKRQVDIKFELGGVKDSKGEPFILLKRCTQSMNAKSSLRKFVEGWRNKKFVTDREASDFDFSKIVGHSAYLQVGEYQTDDGAKASIENAMPLPPNMQAAQSSGYYENAVWKQYQDGRFKGEVSVALAKMLTPQAPIQQAPPVQQPAPPAPQFSPQAVPVGQLPVPEGDLPF